MRSGREAKRGDPMSAPVRDASAALGTLVGNAVDTGLAFLRKVDPDAATDVEALRRREVTRPVFVLVGETKRGKSALTNALIGVPNLSPVDAAVTTAAYLEFVHSPSHGARAY